MVLLGAPLVFPMVVPKLTVATAIGLAALVAYRTIAGARSCRKSPVDWPLALFLFQAMIATVISPFPLLSVSRLACIVFGVIVLRSMILAVRTRQNLDAAVWLYAGAGGLVVGVGTLFGTAWPGFADLNRKITAIGPLARHFPQRLSGIPGADGGFNANAAGAAALFFIPLLTMLILRAMSQQARGRGAASFSQRAQALVAMATLVPLGAVVLFAQSRTTWLALAVVAFVMLMSLMRSAVVTSAVLVLAVIAVVASGLVPALISDRNTRGPQGSLIPMDTRPHLWARALQYIHEAPITGIGLDAFRIKGREISPPFAGTNKNDVHVHNVFLQTALDVGLPGLAAYVALLFTTVWMWRAVDRLGNLGDRLVALGVFGGIFGVTVFGLYDAVMPGTKLSVCFWWSLGLLETLHQRVVLNNEHNEPSFSV